MSWDKNTIRTTEIDATLKVLNNAKIPYFLKVLGKVSGRGNNDEYPDGEYECRKLSYGDVVLMERMECTSDCDADDYFVSCSFLKGHEPKTWELSVNLDPVW